MLLMGNQIDFLIKELVLKRDEVISLIEKNKKSLIIKCANIITEESLFDDMGNGKHNADRELMAESIMTTLGTASIAELQGRA